MFSRIVLTSLVVVWMVVLGFPAAAQEDKPKTGTIIGKLKSKKDTADGKNTVLEVLAPGEVKARKYHVMYDPKAKAPIQSVLAAVRAAKVGDRVEFEWVQTGHGPMIKAFKVLRKGGNAPKKEDSDKGEK
jgi:hypothetical protein